MSSKDLHLFRLIGDPLARFCEILYVEPMPTGAARSRRRTAMRERLAEIAAALEAATDDLDEIIAESNFDHQRGELVSLSWILSEVAARIVKQPSS